MARSKPKSKSKEPESPSPPSPPPSLTPRPGAEFQRDTKRLKKRGKDMEKLRAVIETLCAHGRLESRHRDHALTGDMKGWRDCHVEPDWILIYREKDGKLELGRTGSHADVLE
jgi:mRNA interferase YafQ